MVKILWDLDANFRGGIRKRAKNGPFLVPTFEDHCEVEINLLGLIFCLNKKVYN